MNYPVAYYSKAPGHEYDMKDFCAVNMASFTGYPTYNPHPGVAGYPKPSYPAPPYLYPTAPALTHNRDAAPLTPPGSDVTTGRDPPEVTSYDNSAEVAGLDKRAVHKGT